MVDNALQQKKLSRLRKMMAQHGLDALLLTKNDNTRYVTGYQRYFCSSYLPAVHAVLVTRDAGPVLMLPAHIYGFGEACFAEEVVVFPFEMPKQMDLLRSLANRFGVAGGKIGVEFDFMQVEFRDALVEALPGAKIVNGQPCVEETVVVKFPEEVAILREAARIVDVGVTAILDGAREGMTEKQLGALAAVGIAEGAEFFNHLCVRTGENAYRLAPVLTDRVIKNGDPIQLDIGYMYQGYVSDINRTLILGGPDPEQARVIRTIVSVERETIKALKPGVRACDVYELARRMVADAGMEQFFKMTFIGHSIGISLHENPYITPHNTATLEEGMVFCMEPGLYVPGVGTCRMEDMVVVTRNGCEFLTHAKDDLVLNGLA